MEEEAPTRSVDELLEWVLEVSSVEARQARVREAAQGNPSIEAELQSYVLALQKRPWLESPDRWVIEDDSLPVADRSGREYGGWRIVRSVGGGGSGQVYEAVRLVQGVAMRGALKVLHRKVAAEEDRSGFRRELTALTQVEGHPNVIRLLDGDLTGDGECFLVTEFVEGSSLEDWSRQNDFRVRARVSLFCQLLEALEWVHSKSRVHRDVKPRNLMVCDGRVKLLDFGLAIALGDALLSRAPSGLTLKWASPEQRDGSSRGTPASDQYSAALVLRALLTGQEATVSEQEAGLPVPSKTEGLSRTLRTELAGDLDAILTKALSANPESRYPSVHAFREDLGRYLRHETVAARRRTVPYRIAKFRRREPIASGAIGLLLVALLVTGILWWQTAVNRGRAERRALAISGLNREVIDRSLKELEKLPGTLAIRDMMVRAVEGNLAQLAPDAQDNADLATTLARAHLHMAAVSSTVRGETENERNEAIRHCAEATRLLETVGGEGGPIGVRDLMATAYSCRGDWASVTEEVEWRRREEKLRRELAGTDGSWQRRQEWADAVRLLALAEFETGRPKRGFTIFEQELKLRQQLAQERPHEVAALRELARSESLSGWYSYWLRKYEESTAHLKKASKLYRELGQKESGKEAELALAKGREEECNMLKFTGRHLEAAAAAEESAAIRARQARLNPGDVKLTVLTAKALTEVCWSLQGTGETERVERNGRQAVALLEGLVNTGRGGTEVAEGLGSVWNDLAAAAEQRGDEEEALKRYETSARWYREAVARRGTKYSVVFGMGAAHSKVDALRWSLGKGKVDEPPLLALLRDFEGREEADPNAEEQKAVAWSILAVGQANARDFGDAQESLERARDISRQILRTNGESSVNLYRFGERSLDLCWAQLRSDEPRKALSVAREAQKALKKAGEIDVSNFDIASRRVTADGLVALSMRTAGAIAEADRSAASARTLAQYVIGRFGPTVPVSLLKKVILDALTAEGQPSRLFDAIIPKESFDRWAEWLQKEGPAVLGKKAEALRVELLGDFDKNSIGAKCTPPCPESK